MLEACGELKAEGVGSSTKWESSSEAGVEGSFPVSISWELAMSRKPSPTGPIPEEISVLYAHGIYEGQPLSCAWVMNWA